MNPNCPSCGAAQSACVGLIPASDSFGGKLLDHPLSGGKLYHCTNCQLDFRYPRLSKEQMDELYSLGTDSNWQYTPRLRKDWQLAADAIKSETDCVDVLDVGCFDGQFLLSLGPGFRLHGIEVHPQAAKIAAEKGITIISNDYQRVSHVEKKFDVVVSTDVIEHTIDPFEFLTGLSKLTKKKGLIIICTGNSNALTWKIAGSNYYYCAIADHVSFVNPLWCRWAAKNLGLKIVATNEYCHKPVSFMKKIAGSIKGLSYHFAPQLVAALRRAGGGRVNVKSRPSYAHFPPRWHGAVDHFLTAFRNH